MVSAQHFINEAPGVSCLSALPCPAMSSPDVCIKDYELSLRPRLHVLVPPCCVHRDIYICTDLFYLTGLHSICHVPYATLSISFIFYNVLICISV